MSEETKPESAFDLPDGDWAVLREAKKVPERLRRPVRSTAVALQRLRPDELVSKPSVHAVELPVPAADPETQAAFGAPPVDDLIAESKAEVNEEDVPLPTDEQQAAADAYNEALIQAFVSTWSFGPVSADVIRDLPGDAFDALLVEVRQRNQGDDADEESLASDPSTP
jgi:hypothetical protein